MNLGFAQRALATAVLAFGASVGAMGCHHCKWGDDPKALRADLDRKLSPVLKATEAQKEQIAPIYDRVAPEVSAVAQACNRLHAALIAEWSRPDPDRARVEGLADGFADAVKRAGRGVIVGIFDLHATLTPEQRSAVLEHMLESGKE
jgi:Spy/CpxP family protein refolding chaperone